MAIFIKCKNSLLHRLKTLTNSQLQRLTHTITEQKTRPSRKMEGCDVVSPQNFVIEMSKWKKINANRLGVSRSMIPSSAWTVLKQLHDRGFRTYLVGGCVRDFLLNKVPKDIDVVTTAKLEQVKKIFHRCFIVGRRFPICRVHIKDSVVEVSSFKTVAKHSNDKENQLLPKRPVGCDETDFICWKDSIRRDFTVNSLFYDPFLEKICDYANGMEDIRNLKLRTLKPAQLSFQEDCARILRGLRISGRLGLSISKDTELAISKLGSSVKNLEKGRIMMELNYMLAYGAAESTIYLLQRFNLLELFLPFHAAYLKQQFRKTSSWSSLMLMKLFFNLDKLVSSDRPCHCNLWLGLLAFHQALFVNPQDAFVVWVFASLLYHGSWKEGVKFARKNAKMHVEFVPEISGFSDSKSDDELSKEVSRLAALVQDSVGAVVDSDVLVQSMDKYLDSPLSGLVFVSKKIGNDVARLFDVLLHEIETYKHGRENFMINYDLLGKGIHIESRFVLGMIILETLCGGHELTKEEQEVIGKKYGPEHSDLAMHRAYNKHSTYPVDSEWKEKISKKQIVKVIHQKRKAVKVQSLSEEVAQTKETSKLPKVKKRTLQNQGEYDEKHATVHDKKRQDVCREPNKDVVKVKRHKSDHEENIQLTESRSSNRSEGEKIKHKIRSQEVIKEKSSQTLLSSLFRG